MTHRNNSVCDTNSCDDEQLAGRLSYSSSVSALIRVRIGTIVSIVTIAFLLFVISTSVQPVAGADLENNTTAPSDLDQDVLGRENGYWHNESLAVTPGNGLNDSELGAVVARSMARVEYIRELEFNQTPPVEVISREEYTQNLPEESNYSEATRLLSNIKWEALFMIGENQDAVDVEQGNQAIGVGGFYDFVDEEITIISENTTTPKMDEITLSQELFHYLQDELYDISSYNRSTKDQRLANNGIIEGDANYVDSLYQQECVDGTWQGTCLMPQSNGSENSGAGNLHFGLYQQFLHPYSLGPAWVSDLHESGGWEAVNDIYKNPPTSTEQLIHTETKYPQDKPIAVNIQDTSQDPWKQLEHDGDTLYEQFGEAGLYVALWYPSVQRDVPGEIIPYENHINQTGSGQLSSIEPYQYEHPVTHGWEGEKLIPYVTNDSVRSGETGYVYKIAWESVDDAEEFRAAWSELMKIHGAQPVNGHENTYRIPEDNNVGDAFYITQDRETITIVNAPTISDLSAIYQSAAPESINTDTGETEPESSETDETESSRDSDKAGGMQSDDADNSGPGFVLEAGLLTIILFSIVAARRQVR